MAHKMAHKYFPYINYLVPAKTTVDWEGTIELHGSDFDREGFPQIDGATPAFVFKHAGLVAVTVTKSVTGAAGKKMVEFHCGSGDLSNKIGLEVA